MASNESAATPRGRAIAMDLAIADVNVPSGGVHFQKGPPTAPPEGFAMAKLTTKQRKDLPDSAFADPANRDYPIHDKAHADDAMSRLEGQRASLSPAKYRQIKGRIRAAQRRFGEKPKAMSAGVRVRARIAPGGHLHVTHMSQDKEFTARSYLPITGPDAAGEDGKPVWIQLAKSGHFEGHAKGAFDLNTGVFGQMIRNFREVNLGKVPFDFDHASAMPPNSGSIPEKGAPAQGWIRDLKIDGTNLMALVDWLEPARTYIREKKYQHVSPVIKFGFKDPATGENRGARLVSAALTNDPFLIGMQPIAASAALADGMPVIDAREVEPAVALSARLAHRPGEYMPRIKAALCMSELASAKECSDELGRLRDMHEADAEGDNDGTHEGVALDKYRMGLRDLVGAMPGCTWDEVFDVVQELIDAAIGEHVIEDHTAAMDEDLAGGGGEADLSLSQEPEEPGNGVDHMAGENKDAIALSAAQAELEETKKKLAEATAKIAATEAQNNEFALKLTAAETQQKKLDDQMTLLLSAQAARDAKELDAKVERAIKYHAEDRGLKPEMKPMLLSMAKNNPTEFDALYPPPEPGKEHLTMNLTGGRTKETQAVSLEGTGPNAAIILSIADLADAIAAQKNIPLDQAQTIAMNLAAASRAA